MPFVHPQTEAVHATAVGDANIPRNNLLPASLSTSAEGGSDFSHTQVKHSFLPLGHSVHIPRLQHAWDGMKETSREPGAVRKLEGAWLSAGVGESTQTGLNF